MRAFVNHLYISDVDDDFGDFMAHPSVDTVQKEAQLPAPLIGGTPAGPAPVEATVPMDQTVSNVAVGTAIDNSTQVEPKPKQQQKGKIISFCLARCCFSVTLARLNLISTNHNYNSSLCY